MRRRRPAAPRARLARPAADPARPAAADLPHPATAPGPRPSARLTSSSSLPARGATDPGPATHDSGSQMIGGQRMTAPKTSDVRWLLKDALSVVFKRKRLILGLFLTVGLAIAIAVLSVPSTYEVAGKLVVTRSRGDLLVTPSDQRNFNFALTAPTIQDMAVHAELLKNRSLIESVVKK